MPAGAINMHWRPSGSLSPSTDGIAIRRPAPAQFRCHDVWRRCRVVGHYVDDQPLQHLLACALRDVRRAPGRRQVFRTIGKSPRIDLQAGGRFDRLVYLRIADAAQGGLPVLLQLSGDETVAGVAGGIAAFGEACLVPDLPKGPCRARADVVPVAPDASAASNAASPTNDSKSRSNSRATATSIFGAPNIVQRGNSRIWLVRSQR